jgi:hypothetical protein
MSEEKVPSTDLEIGHGPWVGAQVIAAPGCSGITSISIVGVSDWIVDSCDVDAAMAVAGIRSRIGQRSAMRATLTEETVRVRTLLRETFYSFLVLKGS